MYDHSMEIKKGERLEFGKNWRHFLACINEDRILEAEKSLKTMLSMESLEGKSFLDIGSGNGLFSLGARRLGASVPYFVFGSVAVDILNGKNPMLRYTTSEKRGMSNTHDWLGGYPFEVAKPEEIFNFYRENGFILEKLKTCGGKTGCNEFVFTRM